MRGRLYPGISVTRSLGDITAHRIGVLSEPSVGSLYRDKDAILVVASQGLWNSMSPKEVFNFIKDNQHLPYGLISEKLAQNIRDLHNDPESSNDGGQYHDLTIIIVNLS